MGVETEKNVKILRGGEFQAFKNTVENMYFCFLTTNVNLR